jgi:response regulator RpfG family c-di-GMP phosphodiesterase
MLSKDGSEAAQSRVLLIEAEPRLADFVSSGLGLDGHEVVTAEDGEVGVFLAATEPFDLIVLDMAVTGAPAFELLERVRSARPKTPVVVLGDGTTAKRGGRPGAPAHRPSSRGHSSSKACGRASASSSRGAATPDLT